MYATDIFFVYLLLCCCILLIIFLISIVFLFFSYGSEFIELISTIVFIRKIIEQFFPNGINLKRNKRKVSTNSEEVTTNFPKKIEDAEFREVNEKSK